jgi:hypothetical protein
MQYIRNKQEIVAHYNSASREHRTSKLLGGLIVLTLMSTGWPIFGLLTSYSALQIMTYPMFHIGAVNVAVILGIRAVLMYSMVILWTGLLQVLVSFSLLRGKSFAYKLGLGIPIVLLIINSTYVVLFLFATIDRFFYFSPLSCVLFFGWFFGSGIVWVIINWYYLRKSWVREFLGVSVRV